MDELGISARELARRLAYKDPENPTHIYNLKAGRAGEMQWSTLERVAGALHRGDETTDVFELLDDYIVNVVVSGILGSIAVRKGFKADTGQEIAAQLLSAMSSEYSTAEVSEYAVTSGILNGIVKTISPPEIAHIVRPTDPNAFAVKLLDSKMSHVVPLGYYLLVSPAREFEENRVFYIHARDGRGWIRFVRTQKIRSGVLYHLSTTENGNSEIVLEEKDIARLYRVINAAMPPSSLIMFD